VWDRPDRTDLRERFAILNAYYLPGLERSVVYDSITPVNTFRIILREYFGQKLELLEDSSFFSSITYPFNLIDVTDGVRQVP